VAEAYRLLIETIEDDMRRSLKDMRRRRDARRAPPRKIKIEEWIARAENYIRISELERRALQQMMMFNNLIHSQAKKTIDPEEITKLFKKPISEIQKYNKEKRRDELETLNSIAKLFNTLKPRNNINIDLNQIKRELRAREKEDRKALVEIAKTLAEHSRPRPNIDLEMLKYQGDKIMKDFWDSFNDSPYNLKSRRYSFK